MRFAAAIARASGGGRALATMVRVRNRLRHRTEWARVGGIRRQFRKVRERSFKRFPVTPETFAQEGALRGSRDYWWLRQCNAYAPSKCNIFANAMIFIKSGRMGIIEYDLQHAPAYSKKFQQLGSVRSLRNAIPSHTEQPKPQRVQFDETGRIRLVECTGILLKRHMVFGIK